MTSLPSDPVHPAPFRVGFVPGVTLTKWSRVWEERHPALPLEIFHVDAADPLAAFREGRADVVFARLPVDPEGLTDERGPVDLSTIPLYDEVAVVVVSREHPLADEAEVALADLADEVRHDLDPAMDLPTAVEVVESGSGVAVMTQSLARLYTRKGVRAVPVTDLPATTIALVWPEDATTDEVSDFIGVVRGRTANSTRGRTASNEAEEPAARDPRPPRPAKKPLPRGPRRARGGGGSSRGGPSRGGKKR
ncbi:LysR family substrate-binding domain-containing protein [Frondihabitans cladoniiphilus]|uniref:LysR substrate-binding domain-containing protein n=1 Tax=Frondihabitans cladoniiphilus TaxID=715785 RepID=A0ABP8VU77_9MICO